MSYTVYYDFSEKFCGEDYVNLTWDVFEKDDKNIIKTEQFEYFYENCGIKDKLEAVDMFRESEDYYWLKESFIPIYNYVHILQEKPTDEQVELVSKYVKNCVIIYIEELDVYGIALTAAGTDLSDEIELAYYIIDGVSPIKTDQIDLDDEAAKLSEYCKDVIKKEGRVSLSKIEGFIANYIKKDQDNY